MRRKSLLVRTFEVCLLFILCSPAVHAQSDRITEGSLRAFDTTGKSRGLCPLKQTDVKAEISGFLNRVTVTQTFQNPFDEKTEAVYSFPLPESAAVEDLTIQIGDRFIKKRGIESAEPPAAAEQTQNAGDPDDPPEPPRPSVFTQQIAGIAPNAEIIVVVSYVENLKSADGTYEFAFPMTVGERYIPLPETKTPIWSSETDTPDAVKILLTRTDLAPRRVALEIKLDTGVGIETLGSDTHRIEAQRFSASSFLIKLQTEVDIPNRDFVLKFKAAGETIEAAGLAYKETISATREAMRQLESGGGFQSPLSIATGITQIGDNSLVENRGLVSSTGQRPTSNNFTLDNLSANLGVSPDESSLARNAGLLPALTAAGGTNNLATLAQTQEITVKTMSSAEEQRVAGAEINVATAGGNNTYRGSVFETFGSEKLNANDFFANSRGLPRPASRLNQFGGTLGGFIWQNRAWFFGGYEGLRLRQAGFGVAEVPSLSTRNIPSAIQPLLKAFPVSPNGRETANGFAEFAASYVNPAEHDIFGLRLDLQPLRRLRVGGRYNFADSAAAIRGDRDFSLNTLRRFDAKTNSLSAWTIFTPTSRLVIDGRVNLSRHRIGQQFSLDDFGGAETPGAPRVADFDFYKFDFAGKNSALAAGNPFATTVNQFQTSGSVDWVLNRHQFTFGANFRRLSLDIGAAPNERNVLIARTSPNIEAAHTRVTELTRTINEKPELDNFSLFAQHSWRVSSRLTLNLGVRWDMDFAPQAPLPETAFRNAARQMPNSPRNFAPRTSAAFDVFGNGKSIARGGAGLYFDYGNGAASDAFANSFPFASGAFAVNAPFDAAPTAPLHPLIVFDRELRTPRTWHVFAEFQQELFRNHVFSATYTYSAARKLFLTRTLLDADPQFNYIRLTDNAAESDFKSLQMRFERRFSRGLAFNARYTLAKSTDNFSPDALRETNFVPTDLTNERGASDFDVRHQFSIYGVYDIPTFFSGGWLKQLTEDWSISAFANARTGFPVNVGYFRVNDFGKQFVRAERVGGAPFYLNENSIKSLNRDAFSIPPAGVQGSLPRNALRGFPLFQVDTSLQRRIRFGNEMRLELGISAYNLLNTTNFADMSGSLGTVFSNGRFLNNEYFGRTVSTFGSAGFTPFYLYGGARTIQLSAKFVF